MKDIKALANLLTYIQKHPLQLYHNIPNQVRQTSVGVLLRLNPSLNQHEIPYTKPDPAINAIDIYPKEPFIDYLSSIERKNSNSKGPLVEILFMKRAASERDTHSGQICFPGGKVDGQENDYEACIREFKEEVGLHLDNKDGFIYLGKLPTNFFAYYRYGLEQRVAVHVFFMRNNKQTMTPGAGEVDKAFWVPLHELLNPKTDAMIQYEHNKAPIDFVYKTDGYWDSKIWKSVFQGFHSITLPAYIFRSNKEMLFGLTYSIVVHILMKMAGSENRDENLEKMFEGMAKTKSNYKEDKYGVKTAMSDSVYYNKRLKQFLN